jgi:hypothetical protein
VGVPNFNAEIQTLTPFGHGVSVTNGLGSTEPLLSYDFSRLSAAVEEVCLAVGLWSNYSTKYFSGMSSHSLFHRLGSTVDIQEILQRVWENLLERPSGPLALRFLIQPIMSIIFGIRDGSRDARTGRSPYFWAVLTDVHERKARLREGLAATAKIIGLAFILDAIYQLLKLGTFYPGESVIIALGLAFVPYLLVRGPAARVARAVTNIRAKKTR